MEFLERLESDEIDNEERWLVQMHGEPPHVLVRYYHDEPILAVIERDTRRWMGIAHPRVCAIRRTSWHGERLAVETDDDRGPWFVKAAAQLEDPVERERWCIGQIIGVADGLATLRQRQRDFVHRRLDQSSLFVDVAGHAKLRAPISIVEAGDRAGRMGAGVLKGSPSFMSPEQVRGMPATAATDVFSLAGLLYLALSGQKPFRAETDFGVFEAIFKGSPAPIQTHTPGLQRVLDRAFANDVAMRIPDAGTFAGELWQVVPDAMEYDAVISDRIVAWRATVPNPRRESLFATPKCRMEWHQLKPTAAENVRHCSSCKQDVVRVSSIAAIVPLAGRCVSYTGGD